MEGQIWKLDRKEEVHIIYSIYKTIKRYVENHEPTLYYLGTDLTNASDMKSYKFFITSNVLKSEYIKCFFFLLWLLVKSIVVLFA